jgi:hypothetical protein
VHAFGFRFTYFGANHVSCGSFQALASGKVSNAVDIAKAIDGISDAAVNQVRST